MSCCSEDTEAPALELGLNEDGVFTFGPVKDADGNILDLTGYKLYFVVKVRLEDKDYVILKRSLDAGGSDTQAIILDQTAVTTKGKYKIFIDAVDTINKCASTEAPYVYGTWVVSPAGKIIRVVRKGDFKLLSVVTF